MKGPKRFSENELKKVGIQSVSMSTTMLKCSKCKATWSPNLREGGKLPKGYWQCPKGCNVDQ